VFGGLALNTVFWFGPLLVLALVKLVVPVAAVRRGLTRGLMAVVENWISVNTLVLSGSGSRQWRARTDVELKRDGWYLVIANHQTWVDIVVLQAAFNRRIPLLKFFIKQELIWFPLLGFGFWALDMPFMRRHSAAELARNPDKRGQDLEATRRACEKFRDVPTSVINFAEGTRFSEAKRIERKSPYRHLLPPRAGGIGIALLSMGELFDAALDVTLVYRNGTPSFWGMCCGDPVDVVIDVHRVAIERALVTASSDGGRAHRRLVREWLAGVWQEKDRRIAALADRADVGLRKDEDRAVSH